MGDLGGMASPLFSSLISMPLSSKSRIILSLDARKRDDMVLQKAVNIFTAME
jgi:hypothetical protein